MTTNTTTKKTTSRTRKTTAKTTSQTKETKKLPPNPFMNEILDLVHEQKTDEDKVKILQQYANDALKTLLIWNFDESIISLLPSGEVPYQPNESPLGVDHSSLRRDYKNLYNFVKGGNDSLSKIRRETIFIQILESLHPNEAEVLILVKDKNLEDKYDISFDIVKQAYPDIVWGNRS
jgi:hypothetical protein